MVCPWYIEPLLVLLRPPYSWYIGPLRIFWTPFLWYIKPSTNGVLNLLPMVCQTTSLWDIEPQPVVYWIPWLVFWPLPLIHGIYNPMPMLFWPLSMLYQTPYLWNIEPPSHGISSPLLMVFWPPTHGVLKPLLMVFWHPTHGMSNLLNIIFWPLYPWFIEPPI
jgi:hypothetical protein